MALRPFNCNTAIYFKCNIVKLFTTGMTVSVEKSFILHTRCALQTWYLIDVVTARECRAYLVLACPCTVVCIIQSTGSSTIFISPCVLRCCLFVIERYYILQEKKYTKKKNFFISPVDRCDNISFDECFFFSQKRYFREKKARVYRVKSMQTHRVLISWYIKSCCIYTSLTFETFTWDLIY